MNIRKKDISVHHNYAGAIVLSTMHAGYFESRVYYGYSLKWARVKFIEELRIMMRENRALRADEFADYV